MTDGATYEAVAPGPVPASTGTEPAPPAGSITLSTALPILMQAATQDVGPCALMPMSGYGLLRQSLIPRGVLEPWAERQYDCEVCA